MARKNPFASIMDNGDAPAERPVAQDYTFKGASRSLISSIDEMAAQAGKLLEGETRYERYLEGRRKAVEALGDGE